MQDRERAGTTWKGSNRSVERIRFRRLDAVAASLLVAVVAGWLGACGGRAGETSFVARVGDAYLRQEDVAEALAMIPPYQDSVATREQIVNRWITDQLLVQEARRRNLQENPEVLRRLEENEHSVLISTLMGQIYELSQEPSPGDVRAYFDRNRERLRTRETYVRIRYLATPDSGGAVVAREALLDRGNEAVIDSVWAAHVGRYAKDRDGLLAISSNYFPASQLFAMQPELRRVIQSLGPGQVAPIHQIGETYHVIQFVDSIPEGTLPELEWVELEIRERLRIQARKQLFADQVERLRNEALAREALDVRGQ